MMKRLLDLIIFGSLLLSTSCSPARTDFYVAETGKDANPGTRNAPFRTVYRAKKAVRKIASSGHGNEISVWIGSGTYRLDETLVLDPDDSGPDEGSVVYRAMPGEHVEFSGGIEINNWKNQKEGLWVADLTMQEIGDIDFRELFIDGQRAIRARHPNKDYLRVAEVGEDRKTNFRYHDSDFPVPDNASELELILLHDWSVTRISVSDIDTVKHVITAIDSIGTKGFELLNIVFNIDSWEKDPRYFMENSMVFLDDDREWYYDRNEGLLYLQLKDDESPLHKKVVVPHLSNNLLRLAGTETQKIKNIRFENIVFSYCSWSLPSEGYAGNQACFYNQEGNSLWSAVPAAVEATWSENCSFSDCRFSHLGGSGLWIGTGSVDCLVSGCQFEDISGNGVMIGEGNDRTVNNEFWWKKVPEQVASGNMVENSSVSFCGRQFFGAVGIWCGLVANTSILNNHVFELPYTGISVGWKWDTVSTPCLDNRIEGNHIHHVMQSLSDGGGIYTLGLQPGSCLKNNHIHNISVAAGGSPSNGIFLDGSTVDMEISENLIYNIGASPIRLPKCSYMHNNIQYHLQDLNLVTNNVLGCSGDTPPIRYNVNPVDTNIVLEDNQILRECDPEHTRILESAINKWELKNNHK